MAFTFPEYYLIKYTIVCDKLASDKINLYSYLLSQNQKNNPFLPDFKKDFTLYCNEKGINIDHDAFFSENIFFKKEVSYLLASSWLENKKHTLFSHYEYMQLSKLLKKEGAKCFHERMKSYCFISRPEMLSCQLIDFIFEHKLHESYIKSQYVQNWETVLFEILNKGKYREADMLWQKTGHNLEESFFIKALLGIHDKNIPFFLTGINNILNQSLSEFIKNTIYNITYDVIYEMMMKQWSSMPYQHLVTHKQRQDEIKRIQQRIANIQITMQKKEINTTLFSTEQAKLKRL